MGKLGRCLALAGATVGMTLLGGAPAQAITGAEIVQLLNAQRLANGLPAGLVERPEWSQACAAHDRYQSQTGEFGHHEDPSSPYYTVAGNWAGENSVLAQGSSWSAGNPWENAPVHLIQMLGPALSEMGADESGGYDCATTWPGYKRPAPATLTAYSYPGNGTSGVVPAETARESPFVPGDFVGLPQGTQTGRHLLVFLTGPPPAEAAEVGRATLTPVPTGAAVELRVVDSANPQIGPYMPNSSAFLIPVDPLQPFTTYLAVVDWASAGETLVQQRFSFTTGKGSGEASPHARKARTRVCAREARQARALRSRAADLRARAKRLARHGTSAAARRRAQRLRSSARLLAKRARLRSHEAKECHRSLT